MHEQPTGDAADELQLLTIDEAAQRLRIGRSLAYELARTYLTTGGTDGLPVMKLGARMRVPRWAWTSSHEPVESSASPMSHLPQVSIVTGPAEALIAVGGATEAFVCPRRHGALRHSSARSSA
jgi:hypothetical protein